MINRIQPKALLFCSTALIFVSVCTATSNLTCFAQSQEHRRQFLHALGGPFIVYRSNIQEELQLSFEQKQKLEGYLPKFLVKPQSIFDQFHELESGPGGQEMQSIRPTAYEKLWTDLQASLKAGQFKRLQELELQHEGPAALFRPEVASRLNVTESEHRQFMGIIQNMQSKMEPLMREACESGNKEDVRRKAVRLYSEAEQQVESALDSTQKKQWLEMYGRSFDVFNDN